VSRFAFVAAEEADRAVATLCRVINVSVSGFCVWLRAVPSVRARTVAELRDHRLSTPRRSPGRVGISASIKKLAPFGIF
jgi:hypothetical protein